MKKLFLLFSHKLTNEQIKDAKASLEVQRILYLPKKLQMIWSDINPQGELAVDKLNRVATWLSKKSKTGDYVLIQGDYGAVFYIADYCFRKKLIPIYSATKRKSKDCKQKKGKIIKRSCFKHVCFRQYLRETT